MSPSYEEEDRIIWLKDRESLAKIGYVRESCQESDIRTGPVKAPEGEVLIGYSVLKKSAVKDPENGFCRRIFTLKPGDRYYDPKGDFRYSVPPGAVDPLQVQARKPSRRLSREE
jgi:hypothetical protein